MLLSNYYINYLNIKNWQFDLNSIFDWYVSWKKSKIEDFIYFLNVFLSFDHLFVSKNIAVVLHLKIVPFHQFHFLIIMLLFFPLTVTPPLFLLKSKLFFKRALPFFSLISISSLFQLINSLLFQIILLLFLSLDHVIVNLFNTLVHWGTFSVSWIILHVHSIQKT